MSWWRHGESRAGARWCEWLDVVFGSDELEALFSLGELVGFLDEDNSCHVA